MTIDEVISKKREVEEDILNLLIKFEKETGVKVHSIELYRIRTYGNPNQVVDVRLDIRL